MPDEEKKEVEEVVEEAAEAIEEAKEEIAVAEEAVEKAEKVVEEIKKDEKPEPSGKFKDLIKQIEELSVIELSELVKELEVRFGVSASAPVAAAGSVPAAGGSVPEEEEKSAYNIVLTSAGSNKIGVIKAIREVLPDLGLKEAKDMAEGAPIAVKENVKKEEAEAAKEKLVAAGATVELQ